MLEKPDLPEETIAAHLEEAYGLNVARVIFLPLGADADSAVYRASAVDGTTFFVKLRAGAFDEISLALPRLLSEQRIRQIIPPLPTRTGQLRAHLDGYTVILYPFVEGSNGYEATLSEGQWSEFGSALRRIHRADLPPSLLGRMRREAFSPRARQTVMRFLAQIEEHVLDDPVAVAVAELLRGQREVVVDLVARAERLARALRPRPLVRTVCHSDLHAGNLLLGADGALYIVDWDEPILAPVERDLMYIGAGLLASGRTPWEEEALFYPTYGPVQLDGAALAYYRYERIVQDIAAYCEQLLASAEGGADRERSLGYLASNFLPNGTIALAYRTDGAG